MSPTDQVRSSPYHTAAQVLFHTNKLVLTWIKGEPMPPTLVDDIVKLVPAL